MPENNEPKRDSDERSSNKRTFEILDESEYRELFKFAKQVKLKTEGEASSTIRSRSL